MNIVIPYILGPDDCFELRYALRSIDKFLVGEHKIILIGQKPGWIKNVEFIEKSPVTGIKYGRWFDLHEKIQSACLYDEKEEGFVYTYDDVFFLKETTLEHIKRPIAVQDLAKVTKRFANKTASYDWQFLLWKTCDQLLSEGLPAYNYETHLPRYFDKQKMLEVFEKYDCLIDPWQISTLYYNNTQPEIIPTLLLSDPPINYKAGIYYAADYPSILKEVKGKQILNISPKSYDVAMRKFLQDRFIEKSKYEL